MRRSSAGLLVTVVAALGGCASPAPQAEAAPDAPAAAGKEAQVSTGTAEEEAFFARCGAALRSWSSTTQAEELRGPRPSGGPPARTFQVRDDGGTELLVAFTLHRDPAAARAALEELGLAINVGPEPQPPALGDLARRWSARGDGQGTLLVTRGRLLVHAAGVGLDQAERLIGHVFDVVRAP